MPLHTPPPSGNRRHLTSANAGAFIQQSARVTSTAPHLEAGCSRLTVVHSASFSIGLVRGANLNTTGREKSRDLSTSYAPLVSGMARTFLENQTPAHAAPAIHGATL